MEGKKANSNTTSEKFGGLNEHQTETKHQWSKKSLVSRGAFTIVSCEFSPVEASDKNGHVENSHPRPPGEMASRLTTNQEIAGSIPAVVISFFYLLLPFPSTTSFYLPRLHPLALLLPWTCVYTDVYAPSPSHAHTPTLSRFPYPTLVCAHHILALATRLCTPRAPLQPLRTCPRPCHIGDSVDSSHAAAVGCRQLLDAAIHRSQGGHTCVVRYYTAPSMRCTNTRQTGNRPMSQRCLVRSKYRV